MKTTDAVRLEVCGCELHPDGFRYVKLCPAHEQEVLQGSYQKENAGRIRQGV